MPKSKVRKKNDFTVSAVSRTPVKVKVGPSSVWFVALFIGLMLIGLVWLMVFQLAAVGSQAPTALNWMAQLRAVELRNRVRFHDHRFVAHDALALSGPAYEMNSFSG
nr:cell division protein CrgA [Mycobacterium avium]